MIDSSLIIPFKGENYSGTIEQNLLWKDKLNNIYIMDNHRAALWCWMQEIEVDKNIKYFHLDRHYDCRNGDLENWISLCPDLGSLSIHDYLNLMDSHEYVLFKYDNYGAIFLEKYKNIIEHSLFFTYKEGDIPRTESIQEENASLLHENLEYWTEDGAWIFNIDLDYFFYKENDNYSLMYSNEFIYSFFLIVKKKLDKKEIKVLTIALSPEFCGGWKNAKKVCDIATSALDISFEIK